MSYVDDKIFEDEVRRIARHLWPDAELDGACIVDGYERDGVFFTEDCIHIVEATTSRRLEKAREDISKSVTLAKRLQKQCPTKVVKCWFITQNEPTADQRRVAEQNSNVVAISFSQFQSRLIDAKSYLSARNNYYFGSAHDPQTGATKNLAIEYVPLDLVETPSGNLWDIETICKFLLDGKRFLLLGDYGAGKSMTLREIYIRLRKSYLKGEIVKFPIYLNLRDHKGQAHPAEVLERHARNIGFASPAHLVRAWHAGYAILILDGFDEITSLGWVGQWKKLHDVRFRSMEMIRRFLNDTSADTGLVLAGRAYFFDGEAERSKALSIGLNFVQLNLNNFSDKQITGYLKNYGYEGKILPEWLPSRPLLLGTLVARGFIQSIIDQNQKKGGVIDPAIGWDTLITEIAQREARIEAGIDGDTLRRILERLATRARTTPDGLGPFTTEQITDAFSQICGYPPDEQGMLLLQRLPGLGVEQEGEASRKFIDQDFVDVCRAGDVVEFVNRPYTFEPNIFFDAEYTMHSLGVSVATNRLAAAGISVGKITPAIRTALELFQEKSLLPAELIRIVIAHGWDISFNIYIRNVLIHELEFSSEIGNLSSVEFQDCYFYQLGLDNELPVHKLPKFKRCYFAIIDGPTSEKGLPLNTFEDCAFDVFIQTTNTSDAILDLDIPTGTKTLLTILKKVFIQPGSGRRENALYRGLDHRARRLVPDVLRLLQTEGMISYFPRAGEPIWLPNRAQLPRVHKIIGNPLAKTDPLLVKSRDLD